MKPFSLFARLFNSRSTARRQKRSQLCVEGLESRHMPSVVSAFDIGGFIQVLGNNANSNVKITHLPGINWVRVQDSSNNFDMTVTSPFLIKGVAFVGGSGADTVDGTQAYVPLTLDGGAGSDNLTGGPMGDNLFGRKGWDRLHGGGGSDFLDAWYDSSGHVIPDAPFQAEEVVDGGDGYNFTPKTTVVEGTKPWDVYQGATSNCWILASIAAAAKANIDLGSRITYQGDGAYQVKLLNPGGSPFYQNVSLKGGRTEFDPFPSQEESWVLLMNRAIAQQLKIDWKTGITPGWTTMALPFLTGRQATAHGNEVWGGGYNTANDQEMKDIKAKLDAGLLVCAHTRQGDFGYYNITGSVSTPKLVGRHCYAVVSVDLTTHQITLRNPWGKDQSNGSMDGANDGLVTISFNDFYQSMWSYAVS